MIINLKQRISISSLLIGLLVFSCWQEPNKKTTKISISDAVIETDIRKPQIQIDSTKLSESIIVLSVVKIEDGMGNKFIWDKVKVIRELKNELGIKLPTEIEIAHYSFKEGIPDKECIVYLSYFPLGAKEPNLDSQRQWIVLKGDGGYGTQKVKTNNEI